MKPFKHLIESTKYKLPLVQSSFKLNNEVYFVLDVDDDDAFPPIVSEYKIIDGYVWYKLKNGFYGIVTAKSQKEINKWISDVNKELKSNPLSNTTPQKWKPSDGGQQSIKEINKLYTQISRRFKIKVPKIEYYTVIRPTGEIGSSAGGVISISNPQSKEYTPLNFTNKKIYQPIWTAVHEYCHFIFTRTHEKSKKTIKKLQQEKLPYVTLYGQLSGDFEGFMELMTAYILFPKELEKWNNRLYTIMKEWENEKI